MDFVLRALLEDTRLELFEAGTPGISDESEFITMVKLIYLILWSTDLIILFLDSFGPYIPLFSTMITKRHKCIPTEKYFKCQLYFG